MIAAELRQEFDKKRILFPLLLMVNRIEKSREAGERGHDEGIAPQPFHKGSNRGRGTFS